MTRYIYQIRVHTDPRLGGPHLYATETCLKHAKLSRSCARRMYPFAHVSIRRRKGLGGWESVP